MTTHRGQVRVLTIIGVAIVACLLFSAAAYRQSYVQGRNNCQQIELLKKAARQSVIEGQKDIPAYYLNHPDELKIVQEKGRRTLRRFAESDC